MIQLVDVRLDHPRGGTALVTGASLKVGAGEVALVVGAAGVGTSRLVAATLGEVAIDAGRIEVLGRDVGKLRRASLRLLRRRIGIVPQDLCLLDDRSVVDNVVLPLEIDGVPRSASMGRAAEVLAALGLASEATLPIAQLSGALRQRVAVARALVRRPEIVVADHPTSQQDAAGAELVCAAIEASAQRGAACLVLGRDPALRAIAERGRWRQLVLADGELRPIGEISLDAIDVLFAGVESVPVAEPVVEDNLVPFPMSAGVA